jgi:hypothetical protein
MMLMTADALCARRRLWNALPETVATAKPLSVRPRGSDALRHIH